MRRPLTTICVNVRAAIYDSTKASTCTSIWAALMLEFYCTITLTPRASGLTGPPCPGHHAFESRAVLGVVHALRVRFDRAFRAAFGHGQRLRAARELGNYVMAGIHGAQTTNGELYTTHFRVAGVRKGRTTPVGIGDPEPLASAPLVYSWERHEQRLYRAA